MKWADIELVLEMLEVHEIIKEVDNPLRPHEKGGKVTFKNVKFGYKSNDQDILHGVSFEIESGKSLGIVGSTGAGKSTILRLLYRFYDVKEGCIEIEG